MWVLLGIGKGLSGCYAKVVCSRASEQDSLSAGSLLKPRAFLDKKHPGLVQRPVLPRFRPRERFWPNAGYEERFGLANPMC